jgi:hypothetical protein
LSLIGVEGHAVEVNRLSAGERVGGLSMIDGRSDHTSKVGGCGVFLDAAMVVLSSERGVSVKL